MKIERKSISLASYSSLDSRRFMEDTLNVAITKKKVDLIVKYEQDQDAMLAVIFQEISAEISIYCIKRVLKYV